MTVAKNYTGPEPQGVYVPLHIHKLWRKPNDPKGINDKVLQKW